MFVTSCASSEHYSGAFNEDPLTYLVGEWEGHVDVPGDTRFPPARFLIIYPQSPSSELMARYGIPETAYQGSTMVTVARSGAEISVTFRTGSGSVASLWLRRFGEDLVLEGVLRSANLPNRMILRKKK